MMSFYCPSLITLIAHIVHKFYLGTQLGTFIVPKLYLGTQLCIKLHLIFCI